MNSTGKAPTDQLTKVFNSFFESPKTMKEVDVETDIMRENICTYVRTFRNENRIVLVGCHRCKITGSDRVGIYSTNPALFSKPSSQQPKLFG